MQNKWMTRGEFEKMGYVGPCWVDLSSNTYECVYLCIFDGQSYIDVEDHESFRMLSHINAVMPIEKPEYPNSADVITNFANSQESLGAEFSKVLHDNLDDLYQT
jgi:hypothetical protein